MAEQADNGAETPTESPQSRLLDAGFGRQLEWWTTPGDERVVTMEEAIRLLDSGEVKPRRIPWPDAGAAGIAEHARITEERIRAEEARRVQPPEPPAWLLAQAEVIASATVEKMKPIIRAEVRAALKAEARKQAREQAK
jgi:hypothetical protein